MYTLKKENLYRDEIADLVNFIADFLQYNQEYKILKTFNLLANKIVEIIEGFDEQNGNDIYTIKELVSSLQMFRDDLNSNINVQYYFYGKDKYNLLKKCIKQDVKIIKNDKELIDFKMSKKKESIKVLILSEETAEISLENEMYFNEIIYYDKLMNHMFDICEKIYYSNYDYNYLIKSLEKCKSKDVDTIVVGNSYPLTGIETRLLKLNAVNLSLSSQDLYYSYQLAKKVIIDNKNIKNCVIGAGYYLVNHDLSKGKNEYSINMVKNVYYPILKDKHNSENVEKIEILNLDNIINDNVIKEMFDLDYLDYYFKDLIYRDNNGYFNINFTREMNSALRGISLSKISYEEKMKLGKIRAEQHNNLSKYSKTIYEYKAIFNEFTKFLNENNVKVTVVVFPTTQYYSKFLKKDYKYEFYNVIDELKNKFDIRIIDFSLENIFSEEDFIDFDHMSGIGSNKVTTKLNNILVGNDKNEFDL